MRLLPSVARASCQYTVSLDISHCETDVWHVLQHRFCPLCSHNLSSALVQVNTEMYNALQVAKNTPMEKRGVNTLTPEQSAERIYKLVQGLNLDNTGSLWDADKGIPIPW